MTSDRPTRASREPGDKPFPWRCVKCMKKEVYPQTMPYTAEVAHDGRSYKFEIPAIEIPRCRACGELVFSHRVDDHIRLALRAHIHLLTPEQIRGGRDALDLKQKELAERLGVAEATISRWETGGLIQSRAMDNLLRAYFALPELRAVLKGPEQDPNLGTTIVPVPPPTDHHKNGKPFRFRIVQRTASIQATFCLHPELEAA